MPGVRSGETVRYIAIEQESPLNAQGWLEDLWDAIETLEQMPHRCALAEEGGYRPFEIRKLVHGEYLILFTIDNERQTVFVIGVRHGMRQARPNERPEDPAGGGDS